MPQSGGFHPDAYCALCRKFDRIAKQVIQYLPESRHVADNGFRRSFLNAKAHFIIFILSCGSVQVKALLDAASQVKWLVLQFQLSCFDFRKIENVVDDRQ